MKQLQASIALLAAAVVMTGCKLLQGRSSPSHLQNEESEPFEPAQEEADSQSKELSPAADAPVNQPARGDESLANLSEDERFIVKQFSQSAGPLMNFDRLSSDAQRVYTEFLQESRQLSGDKQLTDADWFRLMDQVRADNKLWIPMVAQNELNFLRREEVRVQSEYNNLFRRGLPTAGALEYMDQIQNGIRVRERLMPLFDRHDGAPGM